MPKKIMAAFIAIMPFNILRIFLWNSILRYKIDYKSKIGWGNIICCSRVYISHSKIGLFNRINTRTFIMDTDSEIRNFNCIKYITNFHMHEMSQIINRNSFIGFDFLNKNNEENKSSNFELGKTSLITINHSFDVTESVTIGKNVVFGGKGSQVWTHGFDIYRNMVAKPIAIGNDIYIGSMALLCQGISIADKTVIGAGTCVASSINDSGFYVSNRLIKKGEIKYYDKK